MRPRLSFLQARQKERRSDVEFYRDVILMNTEEEFKQAKVMTEENFEAAYLETYREGFFQEKTQRALEILKSCSLCPRNCGVDRTNGKKGYCRALFLPEVSSYSPHFGEEKPLVGFHGSGTIFMTHCNLRCHFCQNYSISHLGEGQEVPFERLARMMVELQSIGCHNINFVTPTHYVPQILKSLPFAIEEGLRIPLVYNTGGYDSVETLQLLDGVFDIYMPDIKFAHSSPAEEFCQASDYPGAVKNAIKEMHRQAGDLVTNKKGIALRGLLVRHLVLPSRLSGSREVMHFLATEISKETYVNVMDQYYPCGKIGRNSPLARRITREEYEEAVEAAKSEGLTRLDKI